jgi:hypothetical protein
MKRRKFINLSTAGTGALLGKPLISSATSALNSNAEKTNAKISELKKNTAIAMWDFSWILRHHRYGEFENWDAALEGLAERGYDSIRMDAMPQFVAADTDGEIKPVFRSVCDEWFPKLWGNDMTMSFNPREALLEFLPKCRKYGIKVGLATWFLRHDTERTAIFMEEGGLLRAWKETLAFLDQNNLLDENIMYVDLLNEYPDVHGFDWLKSEMSKRSDFKKFRLDNPDANLPEFQEKDEGNALKKMFYNDFAHALINELKQEYPQFDYFVSLHTWSYNNVDKSGFDAIDNHVWFQHNGSIPGTDIIGGRKVDHDFRQVYSDLKSYWNENRQPLVDWMDGQISMVAEDARKNNIVCGNTEGWGSVCWLDHPEIDWKWIKETADICVDLALKHDNYRFICSSNFTHPHFKGMWEDIKWHKQITSRIKNN